MKQYLTAGIALASTVFANAAQQQTATVPLTVPVVHQADNVSNQQQSITMTKEQLASQMDVKQLSIQLAKELSQIGTQNQSATQNAQRTIAETAALNADMQGKIKQLKDLAAQQNVIMSAIKQTKADIASQRVAVQAKQGEAKDAIEKSKRASNLVRKTIESYKKTIDTALSTGYLPTEQQILAQKQQEELKKQLEKLGDQEKQNMSLDKAAAEEAGKQQFFEQELAKQSVLLGIT